MKYVSVLLFFVILYGISVTAMENDLSHLSSFLEKSYKGVSFWHSYAESRVNPLGEYNHYREYENYYKNSNTFYEALSEIITPKKEVFPSDPGTLNRLINPKNTMIFRIQVEAMIYKMPSFTLALLLNSKTSLEWIQSYYVPSHHYSEEIVKSSLSDLCLWQTPDYAKIKTVVITLSQNPQLNKMNLFASIITKKNLAQLYDIKKKIPIDTIKYVQKQLSINPPHEGYADKESSTLLLKNLFSGWGPIFHNMNNLLPLLMYLIEELKLNPNIVIDENEQSTPLHYAAMASHAEAVNLLLQAGADEIIKNKEGKTAQDLARENRDAAKQRVPQIYLWRTSTVSERQEVTKKTAAAFYCLPQRNDDKKT